MMYTTVASVLVVFSATLGWSAVETSKTYTAFRSKQGKTRLIVSQKRNLSSSLILEPLINALWCTRIIVNQINLNE